ncbi:MAG: hypothetical protein ACR2KO_11360 [Geodermatophilaceae bacterium]|jgi:hypothetical protein|nr:hypothetical protein [Geodermatophilaceae bacterium]
MRLVFVAGWMRSGTTLLTELVGSSPGALAVGELATMWTALEREDHCSCGQPLRSCPVWGVVATEVADRHDIGPGCSTSYLDFDAVVRGVLRLRRLPGLRRLRRTDPDSFPADVRRLSEVMRTVLRTVTEVSGCSVIVDSSKRPTALVVFALIPGVELTPVHLVRDPRAVAFSESRRWQWEGVKAHLSPPGRGVLLSALHWVLTTVACHLVGSRFPGYRLLRFERLTALPEETMTAVSNGLGLIPPPFVAADAVQLAPSHVVNGNPSRFGSRLRKIKADERWRTQLPVTERLAVGVLTAPVRLALKLMAR